MVLTYIKFFLLCFCDFIVLNCGVVLLVVLCGVWFRVLSWCSFSSYWNIDISQLQIQSMIWASTLQMRKHEYFGDLVFIILFVGILTLYAINLGVVSLFADSSFMFLTMFVSDVMYSINLNEWILFSFCQKEVIKIFQPYRILNFKIFLYHCIGAVSHDIVLLSIKAIV